jgi:hypothetical protein
MGISDGCFSPRLACPRQMGNAIPGCNHRRGKNWQGSLHLGRAITNRPQVANLPHACFHDHKNDGLSGLSHMDFIYA